MFTIRVYPKQVNASHSRFSRAGSFRIIISLSYAITVFPRIRSFDVSRRSRRRRPVGGVEGFHRPRAVASDLCVGGAPAIFIVIEFPGQVERPHPRIPF